MDTRIERKSRFKKKHIYSLIGIAVGLLCLLWLLFRDTSSSLKVEKERITIATVQKGEFNDYIRVIGQVLPDRIIYLDAIEGGRVEERLIEEGAQVRAGDVILRLSNPLLNIGILQSEADLAYQENELRNTRLSMEQEHLRLKQDRIGLSKELVQKERRFRQYDACIRRTCWPAKITCRLRKITRPPSDSWPLWTNGSSRTTCSAAASYRAWTRTSGI